MMKILKEGEELPEPLDEILISSSELSVICVGIDMMIDRFRKVGVLDHESPLNEFISIQQKLSSKSVIKRINIEYNL